MFQAVGGADTRVQGRSMLGWAGEQLGASVPGVELMKVSERQQRANLVRDYGGGGHTVYLPNQGTFESERRSY